VVGTAAIVWLCERNSEASRSRLQCFTVNTCPPFNFMHRNRTSLSTKRVRRSGPSRDAFGRKLQPTREVLGPKALEKKAAEAREKRKARLEGTFAGLLVWAVRIKAE